jgi:ribosomal protein S18 acetylase RimI-like enzyme
MVSAPAARARGARALEAGDFERVMAIDRAHTGKARRHFFTKRFAGAAARPDDFVHIGVHNGGPLQGFVMARILRGEFGRDRAVAVLDAIGVDPTSQERGIGQSLIQELIEILGRAGIGSLQSQADWTNHQLLHFFDGSGFVLAPRLALERTVTEPLDEPSEDV